ncbi:hypothetical protein ABK040_009367 [Willaertia magna]
MISEEEGKNVDSEQMKEEEQNEEDPLEMSITFKPIGIFHSCYQFKNATPRQGALVPIGRGRLKINSSQFPSNAQHHSLIGIEEFSHLWLIYYFHDNNNKERLESNHLRPQVKPPRLNGKKVGLFSVRSPHRPNPIGLTLAKIEQVDLNKGELLLSGVDLIDGTPVLDIKPYISRYDSVYGGFDIYGNTTMSTELYKEASWIDNDPVVSSIDIIEFTEEAETQLIECIKELDLEQKYGYKDWIEIKSAIEQMLKLDPRSIYRRKKCEDKVYWFHFDDLNLSTTIKKEIRDNDGIEIQFATVFKCEIWSKLISSLPEEEQKKYLK